jgi:hypothetical protein
MPSPIKNVRARIDGKKLRARALTNAKREIGVKEMPPGSNDGPRVEQYQAVTGAYRAAWCASFVAWSYKQAGYPLTGFNTAYCPSYVQQSRQNKQLRQVLAKNVLPGDIAMFDWGNDNVSDHIGFVTSRVAADGSFGTVEGNTSTGTAGSQSNGGCVAARRRNTRDVLCFVRVVPS